MKRPDVTYQYGLGAFTTYRYIAINNKAVAYGFQFDWYSHPTPHRQDYSDADAQAICDWLNERAQGYPVPEGVELWVRHEGMP